MGAPITVLANVAIDRVDGGPPRAGGCPTFAARLLARYGGSIVTRCAPADRELFEEPLAGCSVTFVASETTASFTITNRGDERTMVVGCTGDRWSPAELAAIPIEPWVHVAPLLAGDVGPDVLVSLRAAGHRISLDGQGLVRVRATGPLRVKPLADPGLLAQLDVLKLSEEEAGVLARPFDLAAALALGVTETIVTRGVHGAVVITDGRVTELPAPRIVEGVDPTGAGDAFMVSYVGARAAGADPVRAASLAAHTVVRVLEARR